MKDVAVQSLKRIFAPITVLFAVMVTLGLLVTKVFEHTWPFTVEDTVNREFERDRTHDISMFSLIFSTLASTQMIVVVTVICFVVLRLTLKRWRESIFLAASVIAQALIFFLTTLIIDRPRPAVDKMDVSPPTSSFPSGHTSASVALYLGLAVILVRLVNRTWLKAACWLLLLVPIGVALGRMYRGMHHPSDVTASFLNGGICVLVMARAILDKGGITIGRGSGRLATSARV